MPPPRSRRSRRKRKASSIPQGLEAIQEFAAGPEAIFALPAPPKLLALLAPPNLLALILTPPLICALPKLLALPAPSLIQAPPFLTARLPSPPWPPAVSPEALEPTWSVPLAPPWPSVGVLVWPEPPWSVPPAPPWSHAGTPGLPEPPWLNTPAPPWTLVTFWAILLVQAWHPFLPPLFFSVFWCVRVLSLRSGVIHGFCDRALTLPSCPVFMWVCGFECACLVSCWSVVFGCRHSCLEFRFCVGVRTLLALHVQSHCVSVRSRVRLAACSSVHLCCVLCCRTQFVFYRLRAFMLSCLVWTRGLWVFSLAACSCPVLHMAGDLFAGHVLVFLFFLWAHGFCLSFLCAMCAHVHFLDPTHLVSWLLVNLSHLSSLVTLLICSLYNLLVFAVLCQFVIKCFLFLPCLASPCPAKPCQVSCFSPTG